MPDSSSHLRQKWEMYDRRLREGDGDGSLVGASFIIARSGVTDVLALLDRLERAEGLLRRIKFQGDASLYPVIGPKALAFDYSLVGLTDEQLELWQSLGTGQVGDEER